MADLSLTQKDKQAAVWVSNELIRAALPEREEGGEDGEQFRAFNTRNAILPAVAVILESSEAAV